VSDRNPYEIPAWEAVEVIGGKGHHITVSQLTKDKIVRSLADHFKEATGTWLVPEEFCTDCDYRRRCEQ